MARLHRQKWPCTSARRVRWHDPARSSTVIEKSIGQMLAKPNPATITPARASICDSSIGIPRRRACRAVRKAGNMLRGLMTMSTVPPKRRPMANTSKNIVGPNILETDFPSPSLISLGVWEDPPLPQGHTGLFQSQAFQSRREKRAHGNLRSDVQKDAQYRQENTGSFNKPQAGSDARRFLSFRLFNLKRILPSRKLAPSRP